MIIETKFSLDDLVWTIGKREISDFVKCDACEGKGKFLLKGEIYRCPKCLGSRGKNTNVREISFIREPERVSKIRIDLDVDLIDDGVDYIMVDGYSFQESELFSSEKEAQDALDEINKVKEDKSLGIFKKALVEGEPSDEE